MSSKQREINRRKRILKHAEDNGNVSQTCRYFGIGRATFYRWKRRFDLEGEDGLVPKDPVGKKWPNQLSEEIVEKILHLRTKYNLGPRGSNGTWSVTTESEYLDPASTGL
jgi:transposase